VTVYNPIALIILAGVFTLLGAWFGAALANSGQQTRDKAREKQEDEAARWQVFGAVRILQFDVNFVHGLGAFNEGFSRLWSGHQLALHQALRSPVAARALDAELFQRILELDVRSEILQAFLESETGKALNSAHRASAAHEVNQQIQKALADLGIDYKADELVFGGQPVIESISCEICPRRGAK